MIPLLSALPWRLIGAAAAVAAVLGGIGYYGHTRYQAGYAARSAEIVAAATKADEKYQKARRARGEPLYRDLLSYRPDPKTLVTYVQTPAPVTACPRLGTEFLRQYNAIAAGQIPAGAVPGAASGDAAVRPDR